MNNTDSGKYLILRIKVFQSTLCRNVAKFGKMNPFAEVTWNDKKWKTQVVSGGHTTTAWNESHVFESPDAAPLTLKVIHSSLLFTHELIGETVISTEDLYLGKNKDWLDLYFEGNNIGKILISACMYEERRSEQSTHATSYTSTNLKEEYTRKQNELELEKEELEFYKKKYKRKLEKLNQEKRNYQNKVKEIVKKATPKHTEETSSEEILEYSAAKITPAEETGDLRVGFKAHCSQGKELVDCDFNKIQKTKQVQGQRKLVNSQGKLSEIEKNYNFKAPVKKQISEGKRGQEKSDWEESEGVKEKWFKGKNPEKQELKLDIRRNHGSPKRANTPKSCDVGRFNSRFKENYFSTGKFVICD